VATDKLSRRQALKITAVAGVGLALGAPVVADLIRRARLHQVSVTRTQLGTAVTVTVVHPDAAQAHSMVTGAFVEIERLEGILSRYRPETALARLNHEGRIDSAPAELVEVVNKALDYSRLSDGAFDITSTSRSRRC
jgi:FAD:protein FMN transferase